MKIAKVEFAGTQYEGLDGYDESLIEIISINQDNGSARRLLQVTDAVDYTVTLETESETEALNFDAATSDPLNTDQLSQETNLNVEESTSESSETTVLVSNDGEAEQAVLDNDGDQFIVPAGIFSLDITAEGENAENSITFTLNTDPGQIIQAKIFKKSTGGSDRRRLLSKCNGATQVIHNGLVVAVAPGGADGEGFDENGDLVCGGSAFIHGDALKPVLNEAPLTMLMIVMVLI